MNDTLEENFGAWLENNGLTITGNFDDTTNTFSAKVDLNKLKVAVLKWHTAKLNEARIDENQSILAVAEHEIDLPGHCYNHEKYVGQCYACQERKWFGITGERLKEVVDERIAQLQGDKES